MNKHFIEEEIKMFHKFILKCLNLIVIRELEIKTTTQLQNIATRLQK